ncbi:D-alanyl-D-alanine carboxypeptidase family protein [Virgibacillus sp. FSP13]
MVKKSLPVFIMVIMGIFILTACTNEQQLDQSEKKDNDGTKNTELVLPDPQLKEGSKGEDVKQLNSILAKIGYTITESNTFDSETKLAIKDFQSQQVKLAATGIYDQDTKKWLKKALDGTFKIEPGNGFTKEDVTASKAETITVTNPKDTLVLVNKHHALPANFEPEDLVIPNVRFPFTEDIPKKYMRKEAAGALEKMFAAGDKAGIDLFAQSGYRSYDRQQNLFDAYAAKDGMEAANKYSARPGESEHQSGLTMDITSPDIDYQLTIEFGDTDEGKWVKDNAHRFGFIIRYPEDKEAITEYQYEPWHLRYVGKDAATVIYEKQITLEEYLGAV